MGNTPKQILFFLPSFDRAGAQRTFLNIVNGLDRRLFAPTLATYTRPGPLSEELRRDVEVIDLHCRRGRWAVAPLARVIRRRRPALLVSTLLHANTVATLARMGSGRAIPLIIRETNHHTTAGRSTLSPLAQLTAYCYRRADAVVCLSKGVAADCISRTGVNPSNVHVIYNPVDVRTIKGLASQCPRDCLLADREDGRFEMIAVGRLVRQKGFDLLLRACAALRKVNWRLTILGEGELRCELAGLAKALGIAERVRLPGEQVNPYGWLARADLFVLSSRWEGFGHVIAEAMICGTPVVATRCPSGPDEIIHTGHSGVLCEPNSVSALSGAIERLAERPEERHAMRETAMSAVERFDVRVIVPQYERLFNSVQRSFRKKNFRRPRAFLDDRASPR